jgi:hypothetical protein
VKARDGFSYDRGGELSLIPEQHRQFYTLNERWVLTAWPSLKDNTYFGTAATEDLELSDRERLWGRLRATAVEAWKFKSERDSTFKQILTAEQAARWRQLELQNRLQIEGFNVIVINYSAERAATLQQSDVYRGDWGPLWHDLLVPYFDSPATALELTGEQKATIYEIIAKYEAVDSVRPEDRKEWTRWLHEQLGRKHQAEERIEKVMTDSQRQQWREMLGEP